MTDSNLEKLIAELGDVDLVRMLTVNAKLSDPEALALAEAEAKRRGLPIDESFIPRPEPKPVGATQPGKLEAAGLPVICSHCDGELFQSREVLLNTRGMTFLRLDWLNNSVTAVRCTTCGLIQFFGEASGPTNAAT